MQMLKKVGIGIVAVIIAEIALFITLGNQVGVLPTLFIIVATGALGIFLARKEGFQAVRNLQASLQARQAPGPAVLDAMCVFIGGILLILPGFLTDIMGLVFILPFTRKFVQAYMYKALRKQLKKSSVVIVQR